MRILLFQDRPDQKFLKKCETPSQQKTAGHERQATPISETPDGQKVRPNLQNSQCKKG
jgi:hypothetical protein